MVAFAEQKHEHSIEEREAGGMLCSKLRQERNVLQQQQHQRRRGSGDDQ